MDGRVKPGHDTESEAHAELILRLARHFAGGVDAQPA
jgi:hypothetical protein